MPYYREIKTLGNLCPHCHSSRLVLMEYEYGVYWFCIICSREFTVEKANQIE